MIGTIIFMLINKGSKSEINQPFLYVGNGKFIRICVNGGNPFDNVAIKNFDGKRVEVAGNMNQYDTFVVDTIKEI